MGKKHVRQLLNLLYRARRLASGAFALLLLLSVSNAFAGFVNGSFQIDVAESERLLEAMLQQQRGEISQMQLNMIRDDESCKNPAVRLIDRNRPAIMIQNTSDAASTNELTRFVIDLQEPGFEFGMGGDFAHDPLTSLTMLSNRSDPGMTLSASYGTVSDIDPTLDPTKLILDIGGLGAEEALIFRLDLDPVGAASVMFPDYRQVLLGGDIGDGNGPGDPALLTATFSMGSMSSTTTPAAFVDPSITDPDVLEALSRAGFLDGYRTQTGSQSFTFGGETTFIPEPSSAVLLLGMLAGLGILRRR